VLTKLRAAGCSDRGPVRRTNEDTWCVDEELGVLIVADGMGGHAAGEVASRLAVDAVLGFLRRTSEDAEISWPYGIDSHLSLNANRLRTAVHLANRRVFREAENHDDYTGMGTTIAVALVWEGLLSLAHVGDSRIYHLTQGTLAQLTKDDSWAATVLGRPSLPSPGGSQAMRHVLTNVLGARDHTEVHIQDRPIAAGDRLLLCSDGLHGALEASDMQQLMEQHSVTHAAAALVRLALDRGTRDNVTVVIGACEGS
jgi:serine/threonine protein phosphatase PrpC